MADPFLLMYGGGNEGGAVEYLLHLMGNVNHRLYRPVFVSMGRDTLGQAVQSMGFDYHVVSAPLAVSRLARSCGARFLHTHGVRANFAGRLAGALTGLPSITTVHSMIALDYVSAPMRIAATLMDNATLPLATRLIAVSEAIAQDVIRRGAKPDRVRVVYNGITPAQPAPREALRAELGLAPGTLALFTAARLHPVKGLEYLLQAVASLEGRLPDFQLLIAGDGPIRAELEAQARSLGLGGRVRFLGHVPDARRLLPAFDLYVSSSLMEALGLSIMEALAAGVPVVATGVGGVLEMVTDGESALLVPPKDAGALAAAIHRLATDPALASRLARAAYDRFTENFSVEQFARRTEAVYREVLG